MMIIKLLYLVTTFALQTELAEAAVTYGVGSKSKSTQCQQQTIYD